MRDLQALHSPHPCLYQPKCPGCPRYGQWTLPPAGLAQLRELSQLWGGPLVEEHPFEGQGHRFRSKLSVRGRVGEIQIGIFESGSHRLVHIPHCPVHHPAIVELTLRLVAAANAAGVVPYDETLHTGQLKAVQFAVHPESKKVQLVLLIKQDQLSWESLDQRLVTLAHALRESTHSLFFATLPLKSNSLFGKDWLHVSGPATLDDHVGSTLVHYPPDAFGQANPQLHQQAVQLIQSFVAADCKVVEYYAGVGTIGAGLLGKGCQLSFNEVAGGSLSGLRLALAKVAEFELNSKIFEGRAGAFAQVYNQDSIVIVDPPRKGLDVELLTQLTNSPPQRLIYLSCGLDSLLRESELLRRSGLYALHHISAWAYFPYTEHIETLLVFDRREPDLAIDAELHKSENKTTPDQV